MFHELEERIHSFLSVCGMFGAVVFFKFEICREQTFLRLVFKFKSDEMNLVYDVKS